MHGERREKKVRGEGVSPPRAREASSLYYPQPAMTDTNKRSGDFAQAPFPRSSRDYDYDYYDDDDDDHHHPHLDVPFAERPM